MGIVLQVAITASPVVKPLSASASSTIPDTSPPGMYGILGQRTSDTLPLSVR
jgi:hypothetical protein